MTSFEKACSDVDYSDHVFDYENVIAFEKDAKIATVTFCQGRYITKVKQLAEKYPDDVQIVAVNYRDDKISSIVAHLPVKAIKISIIEGKAPNLTEEQIAKRNESLRKYREEKRRRSSETP